LCANRLNDLVTRASWPSFCGLGRWSSSARARCRVSPEHSRLEPRLPNARAGRAGRRGTPRDARATRGAAETVTHPHPPPTHRRALTAARLRRETAHRAHHRPAPNRTRCCR
jgi:hypothetical protein